MRQMTSLIAGLLLTVLTIGNPSVATAGQIYVEGYNSELAILDPTTGAITEIGATLNGSTLVKLGGMAFSASGTLYGLGLDNNLYTVNTATAALTLIGPAPVSFANGGSMGNTSNGAIYAVGDGVVYTYNPNTGAFTNIGNLGFNTGADINGDGSGNLYIIQNANESLYRVNPLTGQGTLIGPGNYGGVFGMAFSNGAMYAMQFEGTGIYALDLATGSDTLVSNYNPSIIGSIYTAAAQISSVPEPSAITMSVIAGLTLAGYYGCRRLKATT